MNISESKILDLCTILFIILSDETVVEAKWPMFFVTVTC
jgi:hypothetical protein